MPQAQIKQFPGYGVIYPDGVSGVKVVGTFTQGPSKTVNPDGSVAYSTPLPTIHELFGGGFAYASGRPVTDRKHLEMLPSGMRGRALEWFDGSGELSVVAKENIPPLNLDEKERPEPVYVLSTDLPTEKDDVTKGLDKIVKDDSGPLFGKIEQVQLQDSLATIASSLSSLAETVKEQGKQIMELKSQPSKAKNKKPSSDKRSEMMKARWADPEWRAKMKGKNGKDVT